jgi:hypothetical protein
MEALNLQGISSDLYNWLKQQAEAHQQSINDEVITLLENLRHKNNHSSNLSSDEKFAAIMEISRRCRTLSQLDMRSDDEIIGYDQNGVPT